MNDIRPNRIGRFFLGLLLFKIKKMSIIYVLMLGGFL